MHITMQLRSHSLSTSPDFIAVDQTNLPSHRTIIIFVTIFSIYHMMIDLSLVKLQFYLMYIIDLFDGWVWQYDIQQTLLFDFGV